MSPRLHFVYLLPAQAKWKSGWGILEPPFRRPYASRWPLVKWPEPVYAPFSITHKVTQALSREYDVRLYDWNEQVSVDAAPDDIVMVHPKVDGSHLDNAGNPLAMDESSVAWRGLVGNPEVRRIVFMPYVPPCDSQWLYKVLPHTSREFIAICGAHWTEGFETSQVGRGVKRFLRLDMCVDAEVYSHVKASFNPPRRRKFLYVGHTASYKNTSMLEAIAESVPEFQGGHIGHGEVRGWRKLGASIAFTPDTMRELAKEYDFFLTVSSGDAQATTVLEQSCFGLVIGCTPETGYRLPGAYSLHVSDLRWNVEVVGKMQEASCDELLSRAQASRDYVVREHSWSVFTSRMIDFLKVTM